MLLSSLKLHLHLHRTAKLVDSFHSCSHPLSKLFRFMLGKNVSQETYLSIPLDYILYFILTLHPCPIIPQFFQLFRYNFIYVPVSNDTIKLALDICISPHSQQNPCLFRRPFIGRHFAQHSRTSFTCTA